MTDLPIKKTYHPQEVADYYRVSRKSVYRWIQIKALRAVSVNGRLRIPREAIEEAREIQGEG
jgi:excisionase family DNA binding protein